MFEPQAEREATAGALDSAESMPAATKPSVKEVRFWLFMALSKNLLKNLSENSLKMRHGLKAKCRSNIHQHQDLTRRRMARERRGAGSSLVSMETPYYKAIY